MKEKRGSENKEKQSWSGRHVLLGSVMSLLLLIGGETQAQRKKTRQVQEVNFSEMNLKGTIRNPDGAYLVQKRGIKFMPLYDVQKDLDQRIRETALYID
jgi:hypothetical protein